MDLLSLEMLFSVSSVVMCVCKYLLGIQFHLNTKATNHREEAKEAEAFKRRSCVSPSRNGR